MGITAPMNCCSCGGTVYVQEGSNTVKCSYCGLLMEVRGDSGIKKITLPSIVGRDNAIADIRKWWESGYKASDLPQRGEVSECYPFYVPFWRLKAKAMGLVCGYASEPDRSVPKEILVYRSMAWDEVACDPGDIGIEHLKSTIGEALHGIKGRALPYNEGSLPAFGVTTSYGDAMSRGLRHIRNRAERDAIINNHIYSPFTDIRVLPNELCLIFYPVWVIRYKYSNRTYFATVDGVNGGVLTGRAPAGRIMRNIIIAVGMATGGFGSALSLWVGMHIGYTGSNFIYALTVSAIPIPCMIFAYLCYCVYIEGPDIVYGGEYGNNSA